MHEIAKPAARSELLRYAPHIDGLRAIAILAVVANHIGLPGFSGGYVGVDIFFVISGFLIITQIIDDLGRRSFSFADFWSRRALRILPPLLVVLVSSVALGCYFSVTSGEFFTLGQEALYSALMAINFLLLAQQGYFDTMATTKPFLHIWSLAVEEQFYLVAPLLLALAVPAFRRWPKTLAVVAVVAFAASLAASIYYSQSSANLAFYLMPTRAWEFIAGGAIGLSIPHLKRLPETAAEVLGWGGLAILLVPICGYRPDANYPSYLATLPVLGSALVIAVGLAFPSCRPAQLMSIRPLVWIGLVSYAWYLWHWPLIVFAREYQYGELPLWLGLTAVVAALGLAWLTRAWVEIPVKNWRRRGRPKLNWMPAALGTALMFVIGIGLIGVTNHFATSLLPIDFNMDAESSQNRCRLDTMSTPQDCLATIHGDRLGLLLGDSHAVAAYSTLSEEAVAHQDALAVLALPSCPAILTVAAFAKTGQKDATCEAGHEKAVAILSSNQLPLRYAVLFSYWSRYAGNDAMIDGGTQHPIAPLGDEQPAPDQRRVFIDGLQSTIGLLKAHGVARILVVAPTPVFTDSVHDCVPRAIRQHQNIDARCAEPRARVEADRKTAIEWLASSLAGIENVRMVDPIDAYCDAELCRPNLGSTQIYADSNHLNQAGEALTFERFRGDFDWVLEAD